MMFNWLSLVTGFVYTILGVFVIIYKFFIVALEPKGAYMLGALLIAYGIFRIYRAIKKTRESKYEEE